MAAHIVVIDDDSTLQEFYRLLLEGEGYRVTLLSPFEITAEAVAALCPDLLILDLMLGGGHSGWSLLQALTTSSGTTSFPILLATALPLSSLNATWQHFLQEQHIPLLFKPFGVDALLTALKTLLPDPLSLPGNLSYNEPPD